MSMDSTRRICDRPGCAAFYDAVAVLSGWERADGWRMYPTFGLHMCDAHAWLWTDGVHKPELNRDDRTAACSCGMRLTSQQRTLGEIKDAYRLHLAAVLDGAPRPTAGRAHPRSADGEMRALSVRQPWCSALALWGKPVENRAWRFPPAYRGPVALHASAGLDPKVVLAANIARVSVLSGVDPATIERHCRIRGAIIAVAELESVCSATVAAGVPPAGRCDCGRWAVPGEHHLRFAGVRVLAEPVKATGALGLWRVPAPAAQAVRNQLREAAHG